MADKIRIRRGALANIPILDEGELGLVTDRGTVYIGTDSDGNVLLNPVQVADDGYTLDGYLYPAIDNIHGLGTNTHRWQGITLGPGSLHLVAKSTDPGHSQDQEYRISINPANGKLQISSATTLIMEMDAGVGASILGVASDQTVLEHYNQHSEAIQIILKDLDGYRDTGVAFQEFKAQQFQVNQSVLQSIDGYAANATLTEHYQQLSIAVGHLLQAADSYGTGTTEQQHYAQQSVINNAIIQALDGYVPGLTEQQHYQQLGVAINHLRVSVDGYLSSSIEQEHYVQLSTAINYLVEAADSYGTNINEHYRQLSEAVNHLIVAADAYGSGGTEQEHYAQQSVINNTIIQALDGYASVPDTSSIGDGYLAFFINGGRQLAGDNDLFWDRENNRLGIGISPAAQLHIGADNVNGKTYISGHAGGADPLITARPTNDNAQLILGRNGTSDGGGIEFILSPSGSGYGWKINAPDADARTDLRIFNRHGSTSWTEVATIQGNTGRVGIGTTSPNYKLDVSGDLNVAGAIYNHDLSETIDVIRQAADGYTSTLDIGATGDGYLAFYTGVGRNIAGDEDLYYDRVNSMLKVLGGLAEVQVGDANFRLDIATNGEDTPGIVFDTGNDRMYYSRSGNSFQLQIGGSTAFLVGTNFSISRNLIPGADATYDLGINPGTQWRHGYFSGVVIAETGLTAGFTGAAGAGEVQVGDANFKLDYISSTLTALQFDTGDMLEYNRTSNFFAFDIGTTERMRITDVGRVGINNTNPQAMLHVSGDGYFDGYLMPFTDDTWGLGTPSKRWRDLYLGPGSLHIFASGEQAGSDRDWTFGTDNTGRLIISSGVDRVMMLDSDSVGDTLTLGANLVAYSTAPEPNNNLVMSGSTCDYRIDVQDGNGRVNHLWNAYEDGGGYKFHANSEYAVRYRMDGSSGGHIFYVSTTGGTAGAAVTWKDAFSIDLSGYLWIYEQSASPSTPSSGYANLYAKTDGNMYFMNDSGQEHNLNKGYILAASYVSATTLTAPNSYFFPPVGLTLVNTSATEADHRIQLKGPGYITGIRIRVSTNTLATANGLMNLRINGSVVATITIPVGGGTGDFTTATTPAFNDGDYVCWQYTSAGATGSVVIKTIQFTVI